MVPRYSAYSVLGHETPAPDTGPADFIRKIEPGPVRRSEKPTGRPRWRARGAATIEPWRRTRPVQKQVKNPRAGFPNQTTLDKEERLRRGKTGPEGRAARQRAGGPAQPPAEIQASGARRCSRTRGTRPSRNSPVAPTHRRCFGQNNAAIAGGGTQRIKKSKQKNPYNPAHPVGVQKTKRLLRDFFIGIPASFTEAVKEIGVEIGFNVPAACRKAALDKLGFAAASALKRMHGLDQRGGGRPEGANMA